MNKNTAALATMLATVAPSDMIAEEIRKRLEGASLPELVAMLRDTTPPPSGTRTIVSPPPAPSEAPPTVRTLVRRVLGRGSMRSQEVVAAVQSLRPGTPGPTVRSDLSRMRKEGQLAAVGPVRGGKLRVAK